MEHPISSTPAPQLLHAQLSRLLTPSLPAPHRRLIQAISSALCPGAPAQAAIGALVDRILSNYAKEQSVVFTQGSRNQQIEKYLQAGLQPRASIDRQVQVQLRELCSQVLHHLVHESTSASAAGLALLFYHLLTLELLQARVYNYFLLTLVASQEGLSRADCKQVRRVLRAIWRNQLVHVGTDCRQLLKGVRKGTVLNGHLFAGSQTPHAVTFTLIAYTVYLGGMPLSKTEQHCLQVDLQIINSLYCNWIVVASLVLGFRHQFPQEQCVQCRPHLGELAITVVDNCYFRSLIGIYLQYPLQGEPSTAVYKTIVVLVRFSLNIVMTKNIIKKLEVEKIDTFHKDKWMQVFAFLKMMLPDHAQYQNLSKVEMLDEETTDFPRSPKKQEDDAMSELALTPKPTPDKDRQVLMFSNTSSLSEKVQNFLGFRLCFRSYKIHDEYLLLKLKSGSEQLWITVRHIEAEQFQVSFIRVADGMPLSMQKIQVQWGPFNDHILHCQPQGNSLLFELDLQHPTSQQSAIAVRVEGDNFRPREIMIGNDGTGIQGYSVVVSVFALMVAPGSKYETGNERDLVAHGGGHQIRKEIRMTMPNILKRIGDLDLFFLIVSHLLRKIQNQQDLRHMIKQVIDFLECIVIAKGFYGIKVSQDASQYRFYSVRWLSHLATKHRHDSDVIIQLLRLLSLRGHRSSGEKLGILSNIGQWKQAPIGSHCKLIHKIKQIYEQASAQGRPLNTLNNIVFELIVYYKQKSLYSQSIHDDVLLKHAEVIKLVYDCVTVGPVVDILNFVVFVLRVLSLLLDRSQGQYYANSTVGLELTNLAYRLIFFAREKYFSAEMPNKVNSPFSPIGKPTKQSKTGLFSSKSMNHSIASQKAQEQILLQLQQGVSISKELLQCLNSQLQFNDQLKFFDWDWDYRLSPMVMGNSFFGGSTSSKLSAFKPKPRIQNEAFTNKLLQHIYIDMLSFNKQSYSRFSPGHLSQEQDQIFWLENLFSKRICTRRFVQTLRMNTNYESIDWSDDKVEKVIGRSLILPLSTRIPIKMIEAFRVDNIDQVLHNMLESYLQKCRANNPMEKIKCVDDILYVLCFMPSSYYSNTQLIRQELSKEQTKADLLGLVERHLIVKELAKQTGLLVEFLKRKSQIEGSQSHSFHSAIEQYGVIVQPSEVKSECTTTDMSESYKPQSSMVESKNIEISVESQNSWHLGDGESVAIGFGESFIGQVSSHTCLPEYKIDNRKIVETLSGEYFNFFLNEQFIGKFYKVESESEDRKLHLQNFKIHLGEIMDVFHEKTSREQKIDSIKKESCFLSSHIYQFSKMFISNYFEADDQAEETHSHKRKKSFRAKSYKLREDAQKILQAFLEKKRQGVYEMQRIWQHVKKNNKDLWEIFNKTERKNQSVDQICSSMKLKGLIKVDQEKRKIELPKNLTFSNKFSLNAESEKDLAKLQQQQGNLLELSETLYQKQQLSEKDEGSKIQQGSSVRKIKPNTLPVLYVTLTKIYQGELQYKPDNMVFMENERINEFNYNVICANENERRTFTEIERKKEIFEISVNEGSTLISKRYLYLFPAIEVYSDNMSYYFVIMTKNYKKLTKFYEKHRCSILTDSQLSEAFRLQTERWAHGDISNFNYLMHVNDLSGRTFNDMSQYYIFPWVVTNFKASRFDTKFIKSAQNFRDLSKPVGALNSKRLNQLMTRYQQNRKYNQTQSYLYGSYCSNPAIVCNYMVRLQPFSMHHYMLQSQRFDIADRIFYSIANQFECCYTNLGDYKQLLPQFYASPEFLRNRNNYDFGKRQNDAIVKNVELPKWAEYDLHQNASKQRNGKQRYEERFVLRMRKCLESEYVTRNLNNWIDLVFGIYSSKEKAMEKNNMYLPNLYKDEKISQKKQKEGILIYYKQFGQMPRILLDKQHRTYSKTALSHYKFSNSEKYPVASIEDDQSEKQHFANERLLILWSRLNIYVIELRNRAGSLEKSDNPMTVFPISGEHIRHLKIIRTQNIDDESKKIQLMVYAKQKSMYIREIGISAFRKRLELKQEKQLTGIPVSSQDIIEVYEDFKYLIVSSNNIMKFYQYEFQATTAQIQGERRKMSEAENVLSVSVNKKSEFKIKCRFQFTQHRTKIEKIAMCHSYHLLISLDRNGKVYILKLNRRKFEVTQSFKLDVISNCQFVTQMQVHEMGYIYILTNLNRIRVYNLMGDHVYVLDGSFLRHLSTKMKMKTVKNQNKGEVTSKNRKKSGEQIAHMEDVMSCEYEPSDQQAPQGNTSNNKVKAKVAINEDSQRIVTMTIWNHQSSEIAIGTNLGNLYRIDLFALDDSEKLSFRNSRHKNQAKRPSKQGTWIQNLQVYRIGRHWQCWVCTHGRVEKIQSAEYRNADRRNEDYRRKCVLE